MEKGNGKLDWQEKGEKDTELMVARQKQQREKRRAEAGDKADTENWTVG